MFDLLFGGCWFCGFGCWMLVAFGFMFVGCWYLLIELFCTFWIVWVWYVFCVGGLLVLGLWVVRFGVLSWVLGFGVLIFVVLIVDFG